MFVFRHVLAVNAMKPMPADPARAVPPTARFQDTKNQTEQEVMLRLMHRIEEDPTVSQRTLATDLGIALGLMNTYLKRCVKKGWLKARQVPARRLAYYITPEGFQEKSRLVQQYLTSSFTFFRDARSQCEDIFALCEANQWVRLAAIGSGDLHEIATLVASARGLALVCVDSIKATDRFDAVIITDIRSPQDAYDQAASVIDPARVFAPPVLHISRNGGGS